MERSTIRFDIQILITPWYLQTLLVDTISLREMRLFVFKHSSIVGIRSYLKVIAYYLFLSDKKCIYRNNTSEDLRRLCP